MKKSKKIGGRILDWIVIQMISLFLRTAPEYLKKDFLFGVSVGIFFKNINRVDLQNILNIYKEKRDINFVSWGVLLSTVFRKKMTNIKISDEHTITSLDMTFTMKLSAEEKKKLVTSMFSKILLITCSQGQCSVDHGVRDIIKYLNEITNRRLTIYRMRLNR